MTTTPGPYTYTTSWQKSLQLGLRTMLGRAYPRLISAVREREWLFYEVALPLLRIIAFALVYRTWKAPPQYTGFVILGGAMMAFWLNVLWMMAAQLHWERLSGNLELYLMAPASMLWILAGLAVGGMMASLIPLSLGLDAMRQLLFPQGWPAFLPVGWEILILTVLVMLFLVGAAWSFAFIERRAKVEGRLSLKWQ